MERTEDLLEHGERPPRVVIVGGSGGIGRALLAELAQRKPAAERIATYHQTEPTWTDDRTRFLPLDLREPAQIERTVEAIGDLAAAGGLDAVIVASGWLHDASHGPEKALRDLNAEAFGQAMAINATGPLLLMAKLAPLLERPSHGADAERPRGRILAISAKVGSIADNRIGGWYAYRMSKAALNMGVRCMGIELARQRRKPIVCAVHPGTTHTPLSEPFAKRGLKVAEAQQTASRLLDFLASMGPEQQGGFFHWDGTPLPG